MAEGFNTKFLEERAGHNMKILDLLDQAIQKLQAIGLTREAAIKHAGQMFDLSIESDDIAPASARRIKATDGRKRRKAKRGRPSTKK